MPWHRCNLSDGWKTIASVRRRPAPHVMVERHFGAVVWAALLMASACIPWAGCASGSLTVVASPFNAPEQFQWEFFNARGDLPDDRVRAITADRERIWIGTDAGLAVAEGRSWRAWRRLDDDPRRPPPVVSSISVDTASGEVWIGTLGQGLYRFSGGRFDRFDQLNSGLAGDVVFATIVHDGWIWAATNGGVSSFQPQTATWRLCGERALGRADDAVVAFMAEPHDLLAMLSDGGYARLTAENADTPGPLPRMRVLICGADAGCVPPVSGRRTAHAPPTGRVRCGVVHAGEWWIGTSTGLAHVCRDAASLWGASSKPNPVAEVPEDPATIRIGVLTSSNPTIALPGAPAATGNRLDIPAVMLAIEEANAPGGWSGRIPYELVHDLHGYARYGWTLPEDDLATLAFATDVCGIVAWIEPADRSMAVLARRSEVPIVNASPNARDVAHHWLFTTPVESTDDAATAFAARYHARFRRSAPPDAYRSYHAAQQLIAAVDSAGPERSRIAQRLETVTAAPPAQ